jgi:hypothetical protein
VWRIWSAPNSVAVTFREEDGVLMATTVVD